MKRPAISLRLLLIVLIVLAGAYVARNLAHRRPTWATQALLDGRAQGEIDIAQAPEDRNLIENEEMGGHLWAKAHPDDICPTKPPAFHRGCEEHDQSR